MLAGSVSGTFRDQPFTVRPVLPTGINSAGKGVRLNREWRLDYGGTVYLLALAKQADTEESVRAKAIAYLEGR
jgi:hypothetical protein